MENAEEFSWTMENAISEECTRNRVSKEGRLYVRIENETADEKRLRRNARRRFLRRQMSMEARQRFLEQNTTRRRKRRERVAQEAHGQKLEKLGEWLEYETMNLRQELGEDVNLEEDVPKQAPEDWANYQGLKAFDHKNCEESGESWESFIKIDTVVSLSGEMDDSIREIIPDLSS